MPLGAGRPRTRFDGNNVGGVGGVRGRRVRAQRLQKVAISVHFALEGLVGAIELEEGRMYGVPRRAGPEGGIEGRPRCPRAQWAGARRRRAVVAAVGPNLLQSAARGTVHAKDTVGVDVGAVVGVLEHGASVSHAGLGRFVEESAHRSCVRSSVARQPLRSRHRVLPID